MNIQWILPNKFITRNKVILLKLHYLFLQLWKASLLIFVNTPIILINHHPSIIPKVKYNIIYII
jgi:hypothetical protein